jgi:hypothetical protein
MSLGGAFPLTKAREGDGREERRRKGKRVAEEEERKACRLWASLWSWWVALVVRMVGAAGEGRMKAERREGETSKWSTTRKRGWWEVGRACRGRAAGMVSVMLLCCNNMR